MATAVKYAIMRIVIKPAAFGQWHGILLDNEEELFNARGQRPGCVARDLLNWIHYNLAAPNSEVTLEIITYE